MIIVSQNKKTMINVNQMASLYVDSWSNEEFATEPNCFCIKAEKASDNLICIFLGEYQTEERAKEVLQEIISYNSRFNLYKYSSWEQQEYIEEHLEDNVIFDVYEMPKK